MIRTLRRQRKLSIVLVAVFITEDIIIYTTNPVLTFSILEDTEETRKQIRT